MYKFVFVDFDGTLCLHNKAIDIKECLLHTEDDDLYGTIFGSKPNIGLIKYLEQVKEQGSLIVLLTDCSNLLLGAKVRWCDKYCNGLLNEYYSVGIDCDKVDFMQSYLKSRYLDHSEALFIDDYWPYLNAADKVGITIASPQWIQDTQFNILKEKQSKTYWEFVSTVMDKDTTYVHEMVV